MTKINSIWHILALITLTYTIRVKAISSSGSVPLHEWVFRRGVTSEVAEDGAVEFRSWLSAETVAGYPPIQVAPAVTVEWQLASEDTFHASSVISTGYATTKSIGRGSVRASASVSGLRPSHQPSYYRFRVLPDGPVSAVGSFSTLFVEGGRGSQLQRRLVDGNPDDMAPVGELAHALPGDRDLVRLSEQPLGNFVCDAINWFAQTTTAHAPAVCLINGGALKPPGLPAGPVTPADIKTTLPFKNSIIIKAMTGLAILSALENGLLADFAVNESRGAFLQVAGLRVRFRAAGPPNRRVTGVDVRLFDGSFAPLDPCATYEVATNDYLAAGGDGYSMIKAAKTLEGAGPLVAAAVAAFLAARTPVGGYAAAEGRISRCDPPRQPAASNQPACAGAPTRFGGCPINFTLLHYNDVHARVEAAQSSGAPCNEANEASGTCFGGMARMATYINSVRASEETTLLLDAGDMSVGTEWDLVYANRTPSATIQNAMAVAAFTLGNHEFDSGVDSLVSYVSQLHMPIMGCNINATAKAPALAALLKRYAVVELGSTGVRAGIVGWTITTTATTSVGGQDVTFLPVVSAVQDCVADLMAEYGDRVDIIIGLSHGGFASDIEVAAQVGGIDLIIGGHDHYFLYGNGSTPGPLLVASNPASGQMPDHEYPVLIKSTASPGKVVPVTQAFYASRYMGNLQLSFSADGDLTALSGGPVLLGGSQSSNPVARDPATLDVIDSYGGPIDDLNKEVLGFNPNNLSSARSLLRGRESALGNLICDSLRWYLANTTSLPPSDACLVNAGSIRADLLAGNLTTGDVINTLPFANAMSFLNVTGAELIATLESGVGGEVNNVSSLNARFPQVSGVAYSYDNNSVPGTRIQSAAIRYHNGASLPVDPCKYYAVVTNDFMASGGDGYGVLKTVPRILDFGSPMYMALREYVRAFNPLPSGVDGRILRCSENPGCPTKRNVTDACQPGSHPPPAFPASPPPTRAHSPPPRRPRSPAPPRPPPSTRPPPKSRSPRAPSSPRPPRPPPK